MKKVLIFVLIMSIVSTLLLTTMPKVNASEVIDRPSINDTTQNIIGDNKVLRLPINDMYVYHLYDQNYEEAYSLVLRNVEVVYEVSYEELENTNIYRYMYLFKELIFGYSIFNNNGDFVQDLSVYTLPTNELGIWYSSEINEDMLMGLSRPIEFNTNIPTFNIFANTLFSFYDYDIEISVYCELTNNIGGLTTTFTGELYTTNIGDFYFDADDTTYYQVVNIMPNVTSLYYFRDYAYKYADNQNLVTTPHFTEWLGTAVGGFLDMELIPGLSIGLIMWLIIAVAVLIIILKMFAGG